MLELGQSERGDTSEQEEIPLLDIGFGTPIGGLHLLYEQTHLRRFLLSG